ncbi:malate synthase A, partial [Cutibacterium acnes]
MTQTLEGLKINGPTPAHYSQILTPEALEFISKLHHKFEPRRQELLKARVKRQQELHGGKNPTFLPETENTRNGDWSVGPAPADLQDRRVEITGPVERKMMINAMNSGANVFMADLEDSLSPTWANVIEGQINLWETVRRTISLTTPEGKVYKLNEKVATLLVRPRGWHLYEKNVTVGSEQISGSLFDF